MIGTTEDMLLLVYGPDGLTRRGASRVRTLAIVACTANNPTAGAVNAGLVVVDVVV